MTQPTTWEQATQDVAAALPSFSDAADFTIEEVLGNVEEVLDNLRKEVAWHSSEDPFRMLAWYGAMGYVLEKWGDDGVYYNFLHRCNNVVTDVLVLLPKKQHDYGPDNILWGGVQGVVVRAHDKLARIKNLKKRGTLPSNESLSDSYFDLIGYGIVGAMLVKGTFQLPLEADLPKGPAWVLASDDPGFQERAATDRARFEAEKVTAKDYLFDDEQRSEIFCIVAACMTQHIKDFHCPTDGNKPLDWSLRSNG